MDLNRAIIKTQDDLNTHKTIVSKLDKKLTVLKESKQPDTKDLYGDISKYINLDIKVKDYQYILGGDGRSQPWDETRNGTVCSISINKHVYLSGDQQKIVKDYIQNVYNPDHIELI